MLEENKIIELKDEELSEVSGGKNNGMCEYEKLAPTSCSLCAECEYLTLMEECNNSSIYAHCWCNDLNKDCLINLKQYPNVVNKNK